jgi:hypothetical protein
MGAAAPIPESRGPGGRKLVTLIRSKKTINNNKTCRCEHKKMTSCQLNHNITDRLAGMPSSSAVAVRSVHGVAIRGAVVPFVAVASWDGVHAPLRCLWKCAFAHILGSNFEVSKLAVRRSDHCIRTIPSQDSLLKALLRGLPVLQRSKTKQNGQIKRDAAHA